jgi:hypothetical protein
MDINDALNNFDDTINEMHSAVTLMGLTFDASKIIKALDPIAYRCYFHDWADSEEIDTDELTGVWPSIF